MLVFEEKEKPESKLREKPLAAVSAEPTNLTHKSCWLWESKLGHTGGKRVLSPLRHPCSFILRCGNYGKS